MRRAHCTAALVIILAWPAIGHATLRHTWTTTSDFEDGALRMTNVNATDVPDQLQLNLSGIETPYIWIANTGSGTIAQMSTETGAVIRVVDLVPGVTSEDPSRTAVDANFNCWVGLRGGDALGRLGAEDSGLDLYMPNSYYSSQGISEAWDMTRAVAINADGNVWVGAWDNTNMRLVEPETGHVLNWRTLELFASTDPATESYRPIVGGASGYGFAIDAYNNLWVSQRSNHVGQYNATNGAHIMTYSFTFSTGLYGISVDLDGNVWLGNGEGGGLVFLPRSEIERCVAAGGSACQATGAQRILQPAGWPPAGAVNPGICPSNSTTRGVAVDQAGNVWLNCFGLGTWNCDSNSEPQDSGVMHVDGDTRQVLGIYRVGGGPLGITATADGQIWTVNRCGGGPNYIEHPCPNGFTGSGGTVTVLRGSDGGVVATYRTCGSSPYTYSDMAGYTLRSVTLRSGWWRKVYDSTTPDLQWASLAHNFVLPRDTRVQLNLGAANTLGALSGDLPHSVEISSERGTVDLSPFSMAGRYVAVEAFFFTRNDYLGPIIEDLTLSSVCIAEPGGEVCNGLDDDCVGGVDNGIPPITTPPCSTGLPGICNVGQQVCQGGAYVCVRRYAPIAETCDGLDNDCDGRIDEGVTNACGYCGPPPVETCDVLDNDCDTLTDEGVQNTCLDSETCTTFLTCGTCPAPPIELCDGEDNNCNGLIDEGSAIVCVDYRPENRCNAITLCDIACPAAPAESCNGIDDDCDGLTDEEVKNTCFTYADCSTYQTCDPCLVSPAEVCNGLDDDCDNQVDEGVVNSCGVCAPQPTEICDGIDNDCDGQFDEGVTNACGFCGALPLEICDGADNNCDGGIDEGVRNRCGTCGPEPFEVCNHLDDDCDGLTDNGVANLCGTCGPEPPEQCDGIDNDCDGTTDEDTDPQCDAEEAGAICVPGHGECALPCAADECPEGRECIDDYCLIDPCIGMTCARGFICRRGVCLDLCVTLNVQCEGGLVCVSGLCVENVCSNTGCPDGFTCVENECIEDPCYSVTCEPEEICQNGTCVPDPCLNVPCDPGEHCAGGTCYDACMDVICGPSERCEGGFCIPNLCYGMSCPAGSECVAGNCIEAACLAVTCEYGQVCRGGLCITTRAGGPCGEGLSRCGEGLVCYQETCREANDPLLPDLGQLDGGSGSTPGSQTSPDDGCGCRTARTDSGFKCLLLLISAILPFRRRRA